MSNPHTVNWPKFGFWQFSGSFAAMDPQAALVCAGIHLREEHMIRLAGQGDNEVSTCQLMSSGAIAALAAYAGHGLAVA